MNTILLQTVNYSGQTAQITFYPETGGTINIGTVTMPYQFEVDYYYGTYDVYFPFYNNTCSLTVTQPTPSNDFVYGIIPNNDINISNILNNDFNVNVIPLGDITVSNIPNNNINTSNIPSNDLNSGNIPENNFLTEILI